MSEDVIDRDQLLAAFNDLGVEQVDETVSFKFSLKNEFFYQ